VEDPLNDVFSDLLLSPPDKLIWSGHCYNPAMITDASILRAALVGYQHEVDKLESKMAEIRQQLGIRKDGRRISATSPAKAQPSGRRRPPLSAAARARIAEAQRKRWAAVHKQRGQKPPAAIATARKPKRRLSAEARAKLVANLKKARAAKAAKAKSAA
jgi:hypothetical protein